MRMHTSRRSPAAAAVRWPWHGFRVAAGTVMMMMPLLLPPSLLLGAVEGGGIPCASTEDCVRVGGTACDLDDGGGGGVCRNPFYHGGCLLSRRRRQQQHADDDDDDADSGSQTGIPPPPPRRRRRRRVCHSEDPPAAADRGDCQPADDGLDYAEIRILTQNWESSFMEAWILQIVLSEILRVPVTIETGDDRVNLDFYAPHADLGYGTSNDWDALRRGAAGGDCRDRPRYDAVGKYQPCAHVLTEVWVNHLKTVQGLQRDGVVEPPGGLGVVGQQSWFIPRYTGARDPTLLTYLGLAGEGNRRKLADAFKRPTTWEEYCDEVSVTRCTHPDGVAQRAPVDDDERGRLFVEGLYIGHFRKTAENDCDANSDCTGHIADFPCGWLSFVEQQAWHLDIALRSSGPDAGARGWSYSQLTEMWAAANATQSDIIIQWWSPDSLYQKYLGTDAEFQIVSLPPPTQNCIRAAIGLGERCDENRTVRVGSAGGACMEPPYPLQKVIGSSLYEITQDPSIPEAKRSPAYQAIKSFSISSLQLGELFDKWNQRAKDGGTPAFDLRVATCEWLTEHWEEVERQVIPRTFPRVSRHNDLQYREPLFYVSICLGIVALVAVIGTAMVTYRMRKRRVIRHAQIEFLWLLLTGLLLVSAGAIISALPPSNGLCIAAVWLTNLGYTLELVPLIVKVAAIHKLMAAARQMKRIVLNRKHLFGMVFSLSFFVIIFMVLWTVLDGPVKKTIYTLSDTQTADGETIVWMNHFCQSDSDYWRYLSALWHSLLLLAATILAFQTRKLRTDFNETQTLALMIYSHFVFVVLRIITFSLESGESEADTLRYQGLIYSCDAIATILVYFCTKFFAKDNVGMGEFDVSHRNSSQWTTTGAAARGGMRNAPGLTAVSPDAGATRDRSVDVSRTSSLRNSVHQVNTVPSIKEASVESGSEPSDDGGKQPNGTEPDGDPKDRLDSFLLQNLTGLRCRNCGKSYSCTDDDKEGVNR